MNFPQSVCSRRCESYQPPNPPPNHPLTHQSQHSLHVPSNSTPLPPPTPVTRPHCSLGGGSPRRYHDDHDDFRMRSFYPDLHSVQKQCHEHDEKDHGRHAALLSGHGQKGIPRRRIVSTRECKPKVTDRLLLPLHLHYLRLRLRLPLRLPFVYLCMLLHDAPNPTGSAVLADTHCILPYERPYSAVLPIQREGCLHPWYV